MLVWAESVQLKLAITKCSVLHLGYGNPMNMYVLNDTEIPAVSTVNDLGVLLSGGLEFSGHCGSLAGKGFQMVNLLFKVFQSRDHKFLVHMFKTFIRSKLA